MPSIMGQLDNRGAGWLFDRLSATRPTGPISRWWHWLLMSLGCVAGCSTVSKVADFATHPVQTSGGMISRAGEQLSDKLELNVWPRRGSAACPHQAIQQAAAASAPAAIDGSLAATNAKEPALLPPAAAAAHAVEDVPPPPQPVDQSATGATQPGALRSPVAPAPIAPPEPLPTQTISASRPAAPVSVPVEGVQWCRVRVRNVGSQAATQVIVGLTSAAGAQLLWSDAHSGPMVAGASLDFPAIAQIGSQAEQVLVVGIQAADESQRRLRIQVRDAQGGSHRDVQRRWQVAIEPLDTP